MRLREEEPHALAPREQRGGGGGGGEKRAGEGAAWLRPKPGVDFAAGLGLVMGGGAGAVSSAHLHSRPATLGEGKGLRSQRSLVANGRGS